MPRQLAHFPLQKPARDASRITAVAVRSLLSAALSVSSLFILLSLLAAAPLSGATADTSPDRESGALRVILFEDGVEATPPYALRDSLQLLHTRQATRGEAAQQLLRTTESEVQLLEQAAAELMAHYYASGGFFSAEIDSVRLRDEDTGSPEIAIHTRPGCRFTLGELRFRVIENHSSGSTVRSHSFQWQDDPDEWEEPGGFTRFYGEGDPYDAAALEAEFRRIIHHYEAQGYVMAGIEVASFEPVPEQCEVYLHAAIIPGERFHAAGVFTDGLQQHDPGYVEVASGIRQGDLITPGLIREGRRNLENTDFFHDVSEGDVRMRDGEPYVYYEVDERRANNFDLMFGYAPGRADGYSVIGRGALLIRNVGWAGSTMNISFERLESMVTRLRTGYGRQWIGGMPLGGDMQFHFMQQDTSYQVRNWQLEGFYDWTPARRVSLNLGYEGVSANDHPALPVRVLDGVTRSAGAGFLFDNTDSRLNPSRGILFSLRLATGFRRVTDARAEELESRGTMVQQRVSSTLKTYFNPLPRQVAVLSLNGATVESPEYTETDLLRLGGTQSIRGYHEEQFHVARHAWGELEYRYLLDPYSHAFVFAAAGGYERPAMLGEEGGGSSGWLYSGGLGFRYRTPVGLVQFTYAVSADDPVHNGKVHFNLTADF
ncbi:BamA/TamA family outer membrane protein [Balneolales bacterium ANBcel1]|nr:BamA/TamA family outer membrane protein [Balneolales bacterium ANBcel1]